MAQDNSQYSSNPKQSATREAESAQDQSTTRSACRTEPNRTEFNQTGPNQMSNIACRSKALISDLSREAKKAGAKLYGSLSSSFTKGADGAIATVGEKLSNVGESIRRHAPTEGRLASAADSIAARLDTSGRYLMQHRIQDIGTELTGVVRRNPLQSVGVGLGLGVLIGAASARRSRR